MRYLLVLFLLLNYSRETGQYGDDCIGSLNGVKMYSNGDNSVHMSEDGYRFGLKWQCVEFVKRYYKVHLGHEMPNVWGHAIDFFNPQVEHGKLNSDRNLLQFENGHSTKPAVNDLLILNWAEPWGHVAIVSAVHDDHIEIAQQNAGPAFTELDLKYENGNYTIGSAALGWLRLEMH